MGDMYELIPGIFVDKEALYNEEHIWIKKVNEDEKLTRIGLSQPKIAKRGPILYFNFNVIEGTHLEKGDMLAELETTKSIICVTAPFNGVIHSINYNVSDVNELIRSDPYRKGWLFTMIADEEVALMNFEEYVAYVKEELGPRIGMK